MMLCGIHVTFKHLRYLLVQQAHLANGNKAVRISTKLLPMSAAY